MRDVKRLPVATLLLISANLAAAFWAALDPSAALQFAFDPRSPEPIDALVAPFLHQNLIHLTANMVFLAAVGPAVEFATSAWRFVSVYLVGAVCGVAMHWALSGPIPDAAPLIGASGAVAACAAFYSIRFFHLRVPLAPHVGAPIWSVLLLWALLQVAGAVVRLGESEGGGVSYWAHLGGLAAGAAMSVFYRAPAVARLQFGHDVLDEMNRRGPAAAIAAARQHLQHHPEDPRAWRQLAEAHRQTGETDEEVAALLQLVEAGGNEAASATLRLAELGALSRIPALKRARLAERLRQTQAEAAERLYVSLTEEPDAGAETPEALFALAEMAQAGNPEAAQRWLGELIRRFPMHPATDRARARGWLS